MASIQRRVNKEGKTSYFVVFRDMDGIQRWKKAGFRRMDADRLKTKIENSLYSNTYKAAAFTGMRQSELLGIKWDDVDLNHKKIYVRRSLQYGEFLDTKTAASKRGIDIPNFLVNLLKEHQVRQLVDLPENKYNLVFPNGVGMPMDRGNLLTYIFYPVLKLSELPPIRFHDLRHSYASMLIGQNANIKYVQKQLGHSTVQMTLNVYSHLLPDAGRDTIEKLDDILNKKERVTIENRAS